MKRHRFGSHTPEEMRRRSKLGHIVEGLLFAAVGVLAMLGNLGLAAFATAAWPILILIAGLLRSVELFTGAGIWVILWPLALLVAAAQLLLYREPEGAFEAGGGHGRHGEPG